jgi:hypothetical protein
MTESTTVLKYFAIDVNDSINILDTTAGAPTYVTIAQENMGLFDTLGTEGWFGINTDSPAAWVEIITD